MKSEEEIRDEINSLNNLGMSMSKSRQITERKGIADLKNRFLELISIDIARLEWVLGE